MLPALSIGSIVLPTYPLALLLAFWAGTWLAARRASHLQFDGDHLYNASIYGLLVGLLGARGWYVITHWDSYTPDLTQALSLSRAALAPGEGLAFAGLAILIYLHYHKLPLGTFLDAAAPGLALALTIGHLGLFLGGQTLGLPTNLVWGVNIAEATRHPVHLYEALACLLILGLLWVNRSRRVWPSFHFWLLVLLYGASRLLLADFYQQPFIIGDGYLATQVLGLSAMVVALAVMAYNFTRHNPNDVGLTQT